MALADARVRADERAITREWGPSYTDWRFEHYPWNLVPDSLSFKAMHFLGEHARRMTDRGCDSLAVVKAMEEWLQAGFFPVHIVQIGSNRLLVIRRYQDSRISMSPVTMVIF
ncbi:MAG: hypothetical protein AB7I19_17565 [Planctomycetota bacterium]